MEEIIKTTIPKNLLSSTTKIHINQQETFVIGGPNGGGLTGENIVDTYGGMADIQVEVLSLVKIHLKLIGLSLYGKVYRKKYCSY